MSLTRYIDIYDFEGAVEQATEDALVALLGEGSPVTVHRARGAATITSPFIGIVCDMGQTGGDRERYVHKLTNGEWVWDIVEGQLRIDIATRRKDATLTVGNNHRALRSIVRYALRGPNTLNTHLALHQCIRLSQESSGTQQVDGGIDRTGLVFDIKLRILEDAWPDIQGGALVDEDLNTLLTEDGKELILG
jgi:hypothetical protein